MDISELRDMSDEQLELTLNETVENLFRLRMQAQTERLDAPSELQRNRRLIARIKTLQREREIKQAAMSQAGAQTQPEAKKGS
ncbi:MAG: 50S ribosomal protein L29 [Planctomycetota bacterium]